MSDVIRSDLLHLQIRFVAATMSLIMLRTYLLLAVYRYMSYREYLCSRDALTGVMRRRTFLYACNNLLKESTDIETHGGWFLTPDVDRFKTINDTLGHPTGDKVLRQLAQRLDKTFSGLGVVGRMGGDEFVVLPEKSLTEQEPGWKLDECQASLSDIPPAPNQVTGSIGSCRFTLPQKMCALLAEVDCRLYDAQHNGRAGYVLGKITAE
ncbi:GGDEF domain-containing protein [uncultured Gemmiger sp.]|uniref:GGDEF domain-containing protein n=1 Tax=uncultured Gemmiger sp. TaxID=1623490 RepID=UPI002610890B|nr:GGDEF domain-containing protein [uncultured Gemmiger sp.]